MAENRKKIRIINIKNLIITSCFVVAIFGFASHAQAANCGGGVACACGDTVTASTTLSSDLTCTGHGLVVGANNITIDGAGYTITGDGGAADHGINNVSGYDNINVENLSVTGFNKGIYFNNVTNSTIQNVTANSNLDSG
ncbi:hypothetical protein CO115_02730, partial [Candidatus Falkowbacteria bacterium CG_4_9_14_3_um_filter_36_9]